MTAYVGDGAMPKSQESWVASTATRRSEHAGDTSSLPKATLKPRGALGPRGSSVRQGDAYDEGVSRSSCLGRSSENGDTLTGIVACVG